MPPTSDVAVVIPARNESDRIGATVAAAAGLPGVDVVVVVDDGSDDGTAAAAERAGASVMRHARNRGKAAAMETGAEAIRLLEAGEARACPRHLLFLDADLAESAAGAAPLTGPVRSGEADMTIAVFSNRARKGGYGLVVALSGSGIMRATGWRPAARACGSPRSRSRSRTGRQAPTGARSCTGPASSATSPGRWPPGSLARERRGKPGDDQAGRPPGGPQRPARIPRPRGSARARPQRGQHRPDVRRRGARPVGHGARAARPARPAAMGLRRRPVAVPGRRHGGSRVGSRNRRAGADHERSPPGLVDSAPADPDSGHPAGGGTGAGAPFRLFRSSELRRLRPDGDHWP